MNKMTYAITVPFLFCWKTPNTKIHTETTLENFEEAGYPIPLKNHCVITHKTGGFFFAPTTTFSIGNDALYAYRVKRPFVIRFDSRKSTEVSSRSEILSGKSIENVTDVLTDGEIEDYDGEPLLHITNTDFLDMENVIQVPEAIIYDRENRNDRIVYLSSYLAELVMNHIVNRFDLETKPFTNGHIAVNGNVPFASPTKHVKGELSSFILDVYNSLY